MQVGLDVPLPASGYDPAGELHAVTWLKDQLDALRENYMELFLPDEPDPSIRW